MPPIGICGVGLTLTHSHIHNRCNLSLNTLELTSEAFEAALIGDTRQKGLFYLQTSPSTSVDLFQ
jgi:hypothetical protein